VEANEGTLHCDRDGHPLLSHWQVIGRQFAKPPMSRANNPLDQ
jgi:hypothetical protein